MKKETESPKQRGRPRNFDREQALKAAMLQFWQHGYEATSMNDLAHAMDLNPPSIYGAFGDKKHLFEQSINAYQNGPGCFASRALTEETNPRRAIERLLMEAAEVFTSKNHPPGCMVVLSALNCTDKSADVRDSLVKRRQQSATMIGRRIAEAHQDGALPNTMNPYALTNLVVTVFQGFSIRARDGVTRDELETVVKQTMSLWPENYSGDTTL
jgi:TetR/AcrR family transcriptional regulator, copper-responsive repressor